MKDIESSSVEKLPPISSCGHMDDENKNLKMKMRQVCSIICKCSKEMIDFIVFQDVGN